MNRNLEYDNARSRRDVLEPIFRYKKRGLVFLVAVTLAALVILAFMPRAYTSTAKLIVRRSRDNAFVNPLGSVQETRSVHKTWTSEVKSELELLGNRELTQTVVQKLGAEAFLHTPEPDLSGKLGTIRAVFNPVRRAMQNIGSAISGGNAASEEEATRKNEQEAIELLEKNMEISDREDSDIIVVSYTAHSPTFARDVVKCLVESYLETRIAILQGPGTQEFFSQHSQELLDALNETENALLDLKSKAGISTLDDNRRGLQLSLEEVRARKLNTESSLAAVQARIGTLRYRLQHPESSPRLRAVPVPIGDKSENPTTEDLLAIMSSSNSEPDQSAIPIGSNPSNTSVPGLRSNHVMLNPEEYQTLLASLHEEESTHSALVAEQQEIKQQLNDLQEELNRLNELEIPIRSLERKRAQLETKYYQFMENLELSRISQELESKRISNVNIVQHATLPGKPDASGKLLKLLVAMFLGTCGSLGLVYAADAVDPMLRSASDIAKRLGQPPLVVLPRMSRKELRLDPLPPTPASHRPRWSIRTHQSGHGGSTDPFQELYMKLLAACPTDASSPLIMGITGTQPGEGVSTVAAFLCQAFARDGRFKRIMLLDAHPEKHINSMSEQMKHAPFTYQRMPDDTDDSTADSPDSAMQSPENLAVAVTQGYDIIVIDMPAMDQGSHPLRLASALQNVLFVVAAGRQPWGEVQHSLELLNHSSAHLCGMVLNRTSQIIPKWIECRL